MYKAAVLFTISALALIFILSCSDNATGPETENSIVWQRALFDSTEAYMVDALMSPDGYIYILAEARESGADPWGIKIFKADTAATLIDEFYVTPDLGSAYGVPRSFSLNSDNNFLITGYAGGTTPAQMIAVKTDLNGTVLSDTLFGDSNEKYGYDIIETPDGGFATLGWTGLTASFATAFYLCKFDSDGELEWDKTNNSGNDAAGYSLAVRNNHGYVLVGTAANPTGDNSDIFVIGTDSSGTEEWTKRLGGNGNDLGVDILKAGDDFVLAGWTGSMGAGQYDIYLAKIDDTGKVIWENAYGTSVNESYRFLYGTSDGGFLMLGQASGGTTGTVLSKTSSSGSELFTTYIDDNIDYAHGAFQLDDNTFILAGSVTNGDGTQSGYIEKISIEGD